MSAQSKIKALRDFIRIVLFKSPRFKKLVLFAIFSYIALKILKKKYRQRHDKVKYITLKQALHKQYDFIVIGAGTSGSCVAGLLCRDKRRPNVLLIEAGGPDSYHPLSEEVCPALVRENQKNSKDWQYYTVPQKKGCNSMNNNTSNWPRGKICGGSSVTNYMVYVRGDPEDYNEWANTYHCKGWSWDEIVPVFKSLEKCLFEVKTSTETRGFDGLQPLSKAKPDEQRQVTKMFVNAAMECGYKYNDNYNGSDQSGVSYTEYTIDTNGRRATSFRCFVASLFDSKETEYNIDILPNCFVTKIWSKKDNNKGMNRAYAVQIDEKYDIYVSDNGHIVVSGGAIGSPHLLMLSGIGAKKELEKHGIDIVCDIEGIGENLRDHIMQGFRVYCGENKGILVNNGIVDSLKSFGEYLFRGKGTLCTTGLDAHILCQSSVAKRNKKKGNDLQLVNIAIGEDVDVNDGGSKQFNYDSKKEDYTKWGFKNKSMKRSDLKHSLVGTVMNVRPKSVGNIRLRSNNPYQHPLIDPNYLSNPEDKEVLMDGWNKMIEIYTQSEIFKRNGSQIVEYEKFKDMNDFGNWMFDNFLLTIYHPVGTCRMGDIDNDKMAVCSERCRVREFSNLSVIDASSAPNLVAGNTQAMCYLIGCKGAQMLLEDWKP